MKILRTYVFPVIVLALLIGGSAKVNAQSSAWNLTINGADQNGNNLDLVVGTSGEATDGFDAALDQYAPPAPPDGSFDMRIVDGTEDYFKLFRPLTTDAATWLISARSSAGSTEQITLSWDNTGIASSSDLYLLEYETGTGTEQIDLTETTELVLAGGNHDVTVIHIVQGVLSDTFSAGWQLVGYPAEGTGVDPFSIFTNGINGTFFSHNLSYSEETVFSPGVGYWIRLSEAETVSVEPPFLTTISLDLEPGWYLLSGPGMPIAFSDIDDPGNVLVSGSLKGYNGGYFDADSLKPGRGYWVNSNGTGSITMNSDISSPATKQVAKSLTEPEGFVAFRIGINENQSPKFYLGGSINDQTEFNPLSFSMPPLPPTGAFDIRFDNDSRLVSGAAGTLLVSAPGDSLTISHANQSDDQLLFSFIREGSGEVEELEINPEESIAILAEGISEIDVQLGVVNSVDTGSDRPERIELAQNFPNPFNPTTVISYNLPQSGAVTLEVFDMTGRQITVLKDGFQAAGTYNYEFDASNLSSGVYMYRLQSAGSVLTRKMTLIK